MFFSIAILSAHAYQLGNYLNELQSIRFICYASTQSQRPNENKADNEMSHQNKRFVIEKRISLLLCCVSLICSEFEVNRCVDETARGDLFIPAFIDLTDSRP